MAYEMRISDWSSACALPISFNAYRARIAAMLGDKDRMLGAVGHDLRTPLASLRVRVEQIEDDRLRDKMIASNEEMTAMLADILALARSGSGHEVRELVSRSEEHTSELQSLMRITYADFCLK